MENEQQQPQEQERSYVPRPWWQVWGARVLLVLFIALLIYYYVNIFKGGL